MRNISFLFIQIVSLNLLSIVTLNTIAQPLLEEVVVTAQKRTESLQDVSVSVAVTTGEQLIESGVKDFEILSQQIPAINISKGGASDQMYIRGIGSGFNAGFEQAVGTYIDGIYVGRSRGTRASFVDLAQIEVLKGPQSLYFGNSSIAGALSLTTLSPTDEFGGHFTALWAPDHGESNFEGAVNIPISDELKVRIAARKYDIDGYVRNTTIGEDVGESDDILIRGSVLWEPNDKFSALLKYTYSESDRTAPFMKEIVNCPSTFGTLNPLASCNIQGVLIDNTLNFALQGGGDDFTKSDMHMFSANYSYDFDNFTITSVTGYVENEQRELQDLDSGPLFNFNANQNDNLEQFSQEIRLSSDTGGKFEWMAGFYYQEGDVDYTAALGPRFIPAPPLLGAIAAAQVNGRELAALESHAQEETTISAFGSVTWSVTHAARLILGVRWIDVEKDYDKSSTWGEFSDNTFTRSSVVPVAFPVPGFFGVVAGNISTSESWDDVLPTVILEYDLTGDKMTYFSFSQGFKAGGFDFSSRNASITPGYDAELVDTFEVGFKGDFLDRRMRANIAAFYSDYTDVQESVLDPVTFTFNVGNAAAVETYGVEFDAQFAATDMLELSANVVIMEAEYKEFIGSCSVFLTNQGLCPNDVGPGGRDLSGHETKFSPSYSGFISATYSIPVFGNYMLTVEPDLYFTDSYFIQGDFDPFTQQDDYVRLNLRLAVGSLDGKWELALVGKNLNDEDTIFFANDLPGSAGSYVQSLNRERSFAAQLRFNF